MEALKWNLKETNHLKLWGYSYPWGISVGYHPFDFHRKNVIAVLAFLFIYLPFWPYKCPAQKQHTPHIQALSFFENFAKCFTESIPPAQQTSKLIVLLIIKTKPLKYLLIDRRCKAERFTKVFVCIFTLHHFCRQVWSWHSCVVCMYLVTVDCFPVSFGLQH